MREQKSFGRVLEALDAPRRGDAPERRFANPLSTATAPIPADAGEDPGVENLWDHAFAWALDPPPDASPEPPPIDLEVPPPTDDPESIAAELALASFSTSDEFHRARRRFMWRNHPDRRPEIPAALANRRVAIANMLIDRALKGFVRTAPRS
jgi:hypothetical protein